MRRVTVSYYVQRRDSVPMIRLRGKWLATAGFEEGQLVRVEVAEGMLVLKRAEEASTDASHVPSA